jgi:hypothetical protein
MCLALTTGLVLAQEPAGQNWKSFKSTTGFSVKYPGSWFTKGASTDRLMILSSDGGAEAVVIKRGQAMISVKEEEYTGSTLSQLIDHYTQDTDVLSRKNIRNERAGTQGCRDLQQIVSREALVPPEDVPRSVPYMINTEYFCEIHGHKYVTVLRNFKGDKKQAMYQQVALRVAESLSADE